MTTIESSHVGATVAPTTPTQVSKDIAASTQVISPDMSNLETIIGSSLVGASVAPSIPTQARKDIAASTQVSPDISNLETIIGGSLVGATVVALTIAVVLITVAKKWHTKYKVSPHQESNAAFSQVKIN